MVSGGVGYASGSLSRGGVRTICPFCSCGCGLSLLHDSIHTTGTSPSLSHPVSQGRLCARGWGAHEPASWGPRLLHPALRGTDGPHAVSWAEARDRAAKELKDLRTAGKKVGVLVSGRCTNEECYLAVRLARGALMTGNLDAFLRTPYQALLQGPGKDEPPVNLGRALSRLEDSPRILLLEGDLAVTHPHVAFSLLRAVRKGARLVTLGLARTQMSRVAAAHLPLDPQAPQALPPDLHETLGRAAGSDGRGLAVVLAPFSRDISAIADTTRAIRAGVEGAVGANGSGAWFLPLPLRANTRGAFEMGANPERLPGGRPLGDEPTQALIRKAWGMDPCLEAGLDAEAMLEGVQGLVVVRDHPPASARLPGAALQALHGLESLIVLDAYRSPTSDAATVALPLADLSEEEGTVTSLEGRVQRMRGAVPPPGLGRPGWEVLSLLLSDLGVHARFSSFFDVLAELGGVIPEYGALTLEAVEAPGGGTVPLLGATTGGSHPPVGENPTPGMGNQSNGTHWLALEGTFDWGDDLLVEVSPTLCRDGAARRKLYPRGLVTMNPADAQTLGVRAGWSVRLRSRHGETQLPAVLSPRVEEGTLLAPHGFRESLAGVLGDGAVERVKVERT